jgi:hypothetical protein
MKTHQHNKLKMAQTTLGCVQLGPNAQFWAGILGFEEIVESLEGKIGAILARSIKQKARTGFTAQKKAAFQAMVDTGFTVCSGLKALASATGNAQLLAQSDFSRSDLARGRAADVVNRCQTILTLGEEHKVALAAKYHVVAADQTALSGAIATFTSVQTKPRQGLAASASATTDLVTLFEELDVILNEQLDPLMTTFRFTQPTFFAEYETARTIVDSAASHGEEEPAPLAHAA